jgi:hypothetical protein
MTTIVPSPSLVIPTTPQAALGPSRAYSSLPAPRRRPIGPGGHPATIGPAASSDDYDVLDDEDDGRAPRRRSARPHPDRAGLALARLGALLDREGASLERILRLVGAGPAPLAHLAALGQVHVEPGPDGERLAVTAAAAHLEPVRDALADVPARVEVIPCADVAGSSNVSGAADGAQTPTSPASRPSEARDLDAAVRHLGARCDDVLASLAHVMR